MRNSILSTLLILFASFYMSGCSLFSSDGEEVETATVAEESEASNTESTESADEYAYDDFEDGDETVSEGGTEAGTDFGFDYDEGVTQDNLQVAATDTDVVAEDSFSNDTDVDEYPDDDYEESYGTADLGSDGFSQDSVFVDEGGGEIPADAMSYNQEQDLFAKDDTPVVDEPSYADATDYTEPVVDSPRWVPVKKMKTEAFQRAGVNANRLYVVRPGDTMSSVAQKVSANEQDLYNVNPHFNGKSLKVGDKVYYGSSRSPNDSSMKTYYEDMNISPQYYSTQSGDNLRKVSQQLLGYQRSWMEVWATNPNVESKDIVASDLQLRYWPDGADTQMAKAEPTPEPVEEIAQAAPVEESMAEEVPVEEIPVEANIGDVQEVAQIEDPGMNEEMAEISEDEEFNPPPAVGTMGGPPPPPQAVAPPPPPPAPMANNNNNPANPDEPLSFKGAKDTLAAAKDDQMIMGALGGLLILAAIIMLIFIRRSRSKRVNFSQTQV